MQENKTIRVGIELNHVIRNINRQLAVYYQKEYDADIDLDRLDYSRDILHEICKFKSEKERIKFMYEDYPYEIFAMANEIDQMISRDLNLWIKDLTNYEEYNIEVFLYSMKEAEITISSTYYFLAKIGSRVRKVVFPRNLEDLMKEGDIFITADGKVKEMAERCGKKYLFIFLPLNSKYHCDINKCYPSFKEFIKSPGKLYKIVNLFREGEKKDTLLNKINNWFKKQWKNLNHRN